MLDLSPVKLLIVVVVATLLLGPDKLPQVARQLGAAWRRLHDLRDRIDREIRENMPDLPSAQDIAHFVRSPVTLLNQLATFDSTTDTDRDPALGPRAGEGDAGPWPEVPGQVPRGGASPAPAPAPAPAMTPNGARAPLPVDTPVPAAGGPDEVPDDPNMN